MVIGKERDDEVQSRPRPSLSPWPACWPCAPRGRRARPRRSGPAKPVTISVVSLIPGSTQAAINQFNNQVAEFEKANPAITVKTVEYQWTGPTFAAKLAAGTLPTVFTVPFTDARTLGDNGQLADLTAEVEGAAVLQGSSTRRSSPRARLEGSGHRDPDGRLRAGAALQPQLFTQAGLNPNKPPTTWAQLEADAKQIAQKTGKAGYAEMAPGRQHRRLDPDHARLRARRADGDRHRHEGEGDPRQPADRQALNMLKKMRWTDNSMGSNFDFGWSDINQAFAAGQVGMYISGSDVYTNLVQADNINPTIYGLAPIPLAKNKNAGVLGGGTLAAVRPEANPAADARRP